MSTANSTPRLGLMQPGNSDTFDPNDFDNTFGILDAKPGISFVANYASLPTNLTQAQHGSPYMQLDNAALWSWYQPSSSPGSWRRLNSLGLLANPVASGNVVTSTNDPASAPTVCSASITPAGGRSLLVLGFSGLTNVSAAGHAGVLSLWVSNSLVREASNTGTQYVLANTVVIIYIIPSPTPGLAIPIRTTTRVASATGGGGTVTAYGAGAGLIVAEL